MSAMPDKAKEMLETIVSLVMDSPTETRVRLALSNAYHAGVFDGIAESMRVTSRVTSPAEILRDMRKARES